MIFGRYSLGSARANQLCEEPLHSVESSINRVIACKYWAVWELLTDACRSPSSAVITDSAGGGAKDAPDLAPLTLPATSRALADFSPLCLGILLLVYLGHWQIGLVYPQFKGEGI